MRGTCSGPLAAAPPFSPIESSFRLWGTYLRDTVTNRYCDGILRRPSCYSCIRVNSLKSSTDAVIEKLLATFKEKEAEYGSDCNGNSDRGNGNGSFFNEAKEPHNLDECCKAASGSVEDVINMWSYFEVSVSGLDYVLFVRGSGPHSDYGFADSKPPKEVIVSHKCAEAVVRGGQVYVPGIMACSAHVERGNVVAVSVAVCLALMVDGPLV